MTSSICSGCGIRLAGLIRLTKYLGGWISLKGQRHQMKHRV